MGLESEIKVLDAEKCGLHIINEIELIKMQKMLTSMVYDLKVFCEKKEIEWGLTGGSVIGAVRHKGFIPWDDDIDIVMTRDNFDKFRKCFYEWDNRKYSLFCPGDSGYYCNIPRIYNNDTYLKLIQASGSGTGLFIDIFVLDNTPNNILLRCVHGVMATFNLLVVYSMITYEQREYLLKYGSTNLKRKVWLRLILSFFFRFRHTEWWLNKCTKHISKYKDNNSKYVVSASGGGHYFHELYRRDAMCKFIMIEFDNYIFPIMEGYDYFLRLRYGNDYMVIPPENRRERHAIIDLNLENNKPTKS